MGVVPFEHQSGSSIYRRPRVSYIADKGLKKLLHLSAMSCKIGRRFTKILSKKSS
ncbi:transposase [Lutibacter sp.]|uniref:transposase n=1 Tax=Lutibacter sp. TaxID=1925666 RepID=UPI0034566297